MASESNVRTKLAIVLAAAIGIPILGVALVRALVPAFRTTHFPLHSTIEASGAIVALSVARLLSSRKHFRGPEAWAEWAIAALVLSGSLDLFHACISSGPIFFWSRTLPTIVGGLFMVGVWLPSKLARPNRPLLLASVVAVGLIAAMVGVPGSFPAAFDQAGVYQWWAKALNAAGGAAFFAAGLFFVRLSREERDTPAVAFAANSMLFASAGFLFGLARVWDGVWWLFHGLRLLGYLALLRFAAQAIRDLQRLQEEALGSIVREQMAALGESLAALEPEAGQRKEP